MYARKMIQSIIGTEGYLIWKDISLNSVVPNFDRSFPVSFWSLERRLDSNRRLLPLFPNVPMDTKYSDSSMTKNSESSMSRTYFALPLNCMVHTHNATM